MKEIWSIIPSVLTLRNVIQSESTKEVHYVRMRCCMSLFKTVTVQLHSYTDADYASDLDNGAVVRSNQ